MKHSTHAFRFAVTLLGLCSAIAVKTARAEEPEPKGPAIELPEPQDTPATPHEPVAAPAVQLGVESDQDRVLARGLQPTRMDEHGTVIGGYGQFNLTSLKVGPHGDFDTRANVRRLVLFVAHDLSEDIRLYTELEWENALACRDCEGAVEIEQAFLDWKLRGDALRLRAGLVLIPMGILNQWHEPPVFNGVDRAETEQVIIPTTWRELGLGFTGKFAEIYHYELYLTTTLDPTALGPDGLIGARRQGSLAPAKAFAVSGRFEVEPLLGVIAGASFFASDLAGNADFYKGTSAKWKVTLPVLGYAIDARARRWGFEGRVLWTQFFLPHSNELMQATHQDGTPLFPNANKTGAVPMRTQGGYIEVGYDALHELHTQHALVAFARIETYNTQAAVPDGYTKNGLLRVDNEITAGLNYRPIPQLTFKADVQRRDRHKGADELQINGGMGYMF